jgi:hypothetical protein
MHAFLAELPRLGPKGFVRKFANTVITNPKNDIQVRKGQLLIGRTWPESFEENLAAALTNPCHQYAFFQDYIIISQGWLTEQEITFISLSKWIKSVDIQALLDTRLEGNENDLYSIMNCDDRELMEQWVMDSIHIAMHAGVIRNEKMINKAIEYHGAATYRLIELLG